MRCSVTCSLLLLTLTCLASLSPAEVLIPRGTRVRVAIAKDGTWTVQSNVTASGNTVFTAGAPVTGLGQSVQAVDGVPVALRCEEGRTAVRNCFTTEDHALILASRESIEATTQQKSTVVASSGSDAGETSLTVVASDSGASVEVDKSYMGDAPLTMTIKPGRHRIVVRSGARTWVRSVDIASGAKIRVNADLQAQP